MGFAHKFVIIGHRGAAGLAPENTLAGFRLAARLKVNAVELDVQVVDGRLAVFHDEDLKRLLGIDLRLEHLSWTRLRGFDIGQGERIPELHEVLDVVPDEIGVNVELKGPGTGRACARYLNNRRAGSALLVSSFLVAELEAFREEIQPGMNDIPLGLLLRRHNPDALDLARALGAWSLHIADSLADHTFIESIIGQGFQVFVYTVNCVKRCERLRRSGVHGVFTDYPNILCTAD